MADYEPFPTGANQRTSAQERVGRALGCLGLGGLGLGAIALLFILAISSLAGPSGCDLELDWSGSNLGSPGRGKNSERLAVDVTPTLGLADGTPVRVTSDAFDANEIIGVAVCLRTADTQAKGADACDEEQGARYATGPDGRLDATYPVPRVITVQGRTYDCAAEPRRCLVVAADASDYDRSGGRTVIFRGGLPRADLTPQGKRPVSDHLPIGASPPLSGPVAPNTPVTVLASGFQPGEPLLLAYCTSDVEEAGVVDDCEPVERSAAVAAIVFRTLGDDLPRADESGAFTTTLQARPTVLPYSSNLGEALADYGADPTTSTTAGPTTTRPGATTTTSRLRTDEVRCTSAEGGCVIVVAAAADTKRSAVLPYATTS